MGMASNEAVETGSHGFVLQFKTIMAFACLAILAVGVVVCSLGLVTAAMFRSGDAEGTTVLQSMRYHMTADMYHDTMRGLVYKALYAGQSFDLATAKEVGQEVGEYSDLFLQAIDAQQTLDLTADVRDALAKVKGPLQEYIGAAQEIVQLATSGKLKEAVSDLPHFNEMFETLETAMASVSDAIEASNAKHVLRQENDQVLAQSANWIGIAAATILALGLYFFSRKAIAAPLAAITDALRKLARGILDVDVSGKHHIAEVLALQNVVQTFKDALRERASLANSAQTEAVLTQKRAQAMDGLVSDLTLAVGSATRGDLSGRLVANYEDDKLNAVVATVNELLETVDKGISQSVSVLTAFSKADLRPRVSGTFRGVFDELKTSTNAVGAQIADIVGQLRSVSASIKTATGEILSGANDLAERTNKQAMTVQDAKQAMETLEVTTRSNAASLSAAQEKAINVARSAEDARQVMGQTSEAMTQISASASRISNIIGLIDDIAFQTNLLALNASVEAARAGDAGKGFAVVAIEVRRLAQSAAKASADVKVLIEQSAASVQTGSSLVKKSSDKLGEMADGIRESGTLLEAVVNASADQVHTIERFGDTVRLVDSMTHSNAALVEQTGASIEQTEKRARDLDRLVDVFTLASHERERAA